MYDKKYNEEESKKSEERRKMGGKMFEKVKSVKSKALSKLKK